jgi:hypothetical protein
MVLTGGWTDEFPEVPASDLWPGRPGASDRGPSVNLPHPAHRFRTPDQIHVRLTYAVLKSISSQPRPAGSKSLPSKADRQSFANSRGWHARWTRQRAANGRPGSTVGGGLGAVHEPRETQGRGPPGAPVRRGNQWIGIVPRRSRCWTPCRATCAGPDGGDECVK